MPTSSQYCSAISERLNFSQRNFPHREMLGKFSSHSLRCAVLHPVYQLLRYLKAFSHRVVVKELRYFFYPNEFFFIRNRQIKKKYVNERSKNSTCSSEKLRLSIVGWGGKDFLVFL